MQLGVELVDNDGTAAFERRQQKRRQPHELLSTGRLLGQAQLIALAVHLMLYEDALAAPFRSFLNPKAIDTYVNGTQKTRDLE